MNSERDSYDEPSRKVTRILEQTDPEQQNNHHPTRRRGELDGLTRQRGELDRASRPTRLFGELDRASRPTRQFGKSDQLAYLCSVLVAPSFEIGSNLLLFRLDRSHRWKFTI
ncbi:hypothetical protein F2Q70_00003290 [Brassica cretica]|uniref:Uncharacterized protein n=1 Tax=Brassica cretica TaxID=69181 RepID=A0A8S9IK86_BRACR|nr:hypothetical protein F2Q70_00003290 [Brassica cretica]